MYNTLINKAKEIAGSFPLSGFKDNSAGKVAAALVTRDGNIYTGICMSLVCGIGFCAEHSAIAEMLKNRETEVDMIVAITDTGKIIPPCGRCRELLFQINKRNVATKVIISAKETKSLKDLLPDLWVDSY